MSGEQPVGGAEGGPGEGLDVSTEWDGSAAVVLVRGEVDFTSAGRLRALMLDLVRRRANPLVLDLSGTTFLDSTGISLMVQARRRLTNDGGELVLRAPSAHVMQLLRVMNLTPVFRIVDS